MEPFIGQIQAFGFTFAPRGWADCNGQLLSIAQYTALFSLLGTTYGGDGRTTFGLPDLRGRTALHTGTGPGLTPRTIGSRSGQETVTLNTTQMPNHTHSPQVAVSTAAGEEGAPAGNVIANHAAAFNEDATAGQTLGGVTSTNQGLSQQHNNMPPYLTVRFCIALVGLYPSRS